MKNELFLIGDSHINIVHEALHDHGLNPPILRFPPRMLRKYLDEAPSFIKRKAIRESHALLKAQGFQNIEEVLSLKPKIITSMGFELGRTNLRFQTNGQIVLGAGFQNIKPQQIISRTYLRAFLEESQAPVITWLRKQSRDCQILLIPPPRYQMDAMAVTIFDNFIAIYRELGIEVLVTSEYFGNDQGFIPAELLRPDGFHGNVHYGHKLAQILIEKAWVTS